MIGRVERIRYVPIRMEKAAEKPLRYGVEYIEIPTVYRQEKGRKNNWSFLRLLMLAAFYSVDVIRIRFTPKKFL